jgi:hypothetical protein
MLVVFGEEAVDERDQVFAGAGEDEFFSAGVPVELEGSSGRGDVYLPRRAVWRDEEPIAGIDEDDGQGIVLLADFESGVVVPGAVVFGALDEVTLERVEHSRSSEAKIVFVVHGPGNASQV